MSAIALTGATLPPTPPDMLSKLEAVEQALFHAEQLDLATEHVFHAGMYARTIRLPAGIVLTGALVKRATLVIVNGRTDVLAGDGWAVLDGYNVIPASAGRKQLFITRGPVEITMIFPTAAKTVAEAEEEFTDQGDMLASRRQPDGDLVVITGE